MRNGIKILALIILLSFAIRLYSLDYNRNNEDELINYEIAVKDQFFDFIIIDCRLTSEKCNVILDSMGSGYEIAFKDEPIKVFKKVIG